jgi:hypothetical protein
VTVGQLIEVLSTYPKGMLVEGTNSGSLLLSAQEFKGGTKEAAYVFTDGRIARDFRIHQGKTRKPRSLVA